MRRSIVDRATSLRLGGRKGSKATIREGPGACSSSGRVEHPLLYGRLMGKYARGYGHASFRLEKRDSTGCHRNDRQTQPGYRVQAKNAVVHVFPGSLIGDQENFLKLKIEEFSVNDTYIEHLVRWGDPMPPLTTPTKQ